MDITVLWNLVSGYQKISLKALILFCGLFNLLVRHNTAWAASGLVNRPREPSLPPIILSKQRAVIEKIIPKLSRNAHLPSNCRHTSLCKYLAVLTFQMWYREIKMSNLNWEFFNYRIYNNYLGTMIDSIILNKDKTLCIAFYNNQRSASKNNLNLMIHTMYCNPATCSGCKVMKSTKVLRRNCRLPTQMDLRYRKILRYIII